MKSYTSRKHFKIVCAEARASQRGSVARAVTFLLFCLVVFVVVPFFTFGKIVPPNYIGIRQNYYSVLGILHKGYEKEGLDPGLQWKIPGISTVVLIPRDFQFVHFDELVEGGPLDFGQLEVPTTDGSKVRSDIALIFRYFPSPGEKEFGNDTNALDAPPSPEQNAEKPSPQTEEQLALAVPAATDERKPVPLAQPLRLSHGGPHDLIVTYTDDNTKELLRIAQVADNILRQNLSALSTSDFYNAFKREKAVIAATEGINREISGAGVELWAALIQRYVYSEKKIDDQIFAKNLQDQTEQLNAAASKLAEAKAETEKQSALWDAKIQSLQVNGQSQVDVLKSEGALYEAKKRAEGDLALASATADVQSQKASVLSGLSGSDVYVAQEMVPLLKTLRGGVVTDIDPYDIDRWVQRFTGR